MVRVVMTESEQKEYQSVVLAALLHDIGKLLHRRDDATYHIKGGHSKAGALFLGAGAGDAGARSSPPWSGQYTVGWVPVT